MGATPSSLSSRALVLVALALAGSIGCAKTPQQRAKLDREVIERESTPERLQARGDAAAMSGDLTRAEQYFVAAMKAGGDERALTKRLLVVCISDNRYPAAASYAEDYLHKHPGDTDVRYAVSTVYIGLGELTRARDGLRLVVEARPDIADAHYALASVLRDTGESLIDADKQFREYIRLSPNGEYAEAARASLLKSVP
jgi:outer membrane protein assembly factor BamD (BamD/ComL family)